MAGSELNGEVDKVLSSRDVISSGKGITGVNRLFDTVEEGTGLRATSFDEFFEGTRGEEIPTDFEAQPRAWTEGEPVTVKDETPRPRGQTQRTIKFYGEGSPLGERPEILL